SGAGRARRLATAIRRHRACCARSSRRCDVALRSPRRAEHVARDLRHGARGLRRSPGFSLAVILTLALGIGGNTAVFSVVDQLLLRPLPYPDGDQLVVVEETVGANPHADVSPANWLDWQRESRTFRRFAAWRSWSF